MCLSVHGALLLLVVYFICLFNFNFHSDYYYNYFINVFLMTSLSSSLSLFLSFYYHHFLFLGRGYKSLEQSACSAATAGRRPRTVQATYKVIYFWRNRGAFVTFLIFISPCIYGFTYLLTYLLTYDHRSLHVL